MKKLLFIALLAVSLNASAQTKTEPKPIADETYIRLAKQSFKVCTVNETIFKKLMAKFPSISRYYVVKKKDRIGEYWETEISFKNEELPAVEAFLKSI